MTTAADDAAFVDTLELGDVQVTRVVEWHSPIAPVEAVFPNTPPGTWRRNEDWLAPDFYDPATTFFKAYTQTWVLRSEGRTILVDTCGRKRWTSW